MKFLLKVFLPSSKTLAGLAASGIAKAVNDSGKNEYIEKYGNIAAKATEVQTWLVDMLKDGKIDKLEEDDIASKLVPLFDKIRETL